MSAKHFFSFLFLFFLFYTSYAQETSSAELGLTLEETNYLKKKKNISMCVDPNWMPFEKIENGKHIGMSADYMHVISSKIDTPMSLVPTKTWTESIEYAKTRKCDIFSLAMETPKRKKYMNFTRPYLVVPLVIVTTHTKLFIENISEVLDKKIGIVKGYAYAELLRLQYPKINLVEVENIDDGLKQVAEESLFGFIGNLTTVGYKLQKDYIGTLKITGRIDENWELGIGVRNDDPVLLSILDKAIASIDDKDHQRILNQWMSVTFEQGFDYTLLWQIVGIIMLVLFIVLYRYRIIHNYNRKMERNLQLIDKNVLLSTCNDDGIITEVSTALCDLSGYTKEELLGKNHNIFKHPDMQRSTYTDLWETITAGKVWHSELKNKKKDGSDYWIDVIISPTFSSHGTIESYTAIRQNITDQKRIEELSITDPLTQISNRLHLHNTFKREIEFAHRYKNIFSVILVDVDHFKNVNDTFGHDIGDKVLIKIAQILKESLRSTDILGRWGGEEFLIICHETDAAQAAKIAEKLRAKIENTTFEYVGIQTCSFGVSEYNLLDGNSDAVVKRADDALYKAKESGRNQVRITK